MSSYSSDVSELRALGFCGVDDSVDPWHLQAISAQYPFVEWGVLFRPDKEGEPRYASWAWVETLAKVNRATGGTMKLAAHLCGSRCQEVLSGSSEFVKKLRVLGFERVQVNATAANGVDVSNLEASFAMLHECIRACPDVEWIIQRNEGTKVLWSPLLSSEDANVSFLFDDSVGRGVVATSFASPEKHAKCGYAGGIGPNNVVDVLGNVFKAANRQSVWIDMESSLRAVVDGKDAFSIDKAFSCLRQYVDTFVPFKSPGNQQQ